MSVKVAVRVRPFNSREKGLGCECVVDMQDPVTILKANQGHQQRKFTFDFSFWSFDGFQEQADGYMKATGSKYADQQQVFTRIGKNILDNAWQGYHCCLFAYGQTGSGKSYSMIGYGTNKGIVPISCNQIFQRMKNKDANIQYQVHASMLQIYNQQIQDLTIHPSKRIKGGLKIRQNKLLGVYVEGVKKHLVNTYQQIQAVMQQGTKNRTVASTQMNATSSRAHTIITIQFKQTQKIEDKKASKISMINLVDLAGSQRSEKTGATGQRLKQAVGINQSLTTLGQVISILADNSQGANKFVPYRNSALTRILSNALGGNSQTIMICAISPADDNYDETLSTLRYADRAKKIKNKPVVNESQADKLIRQLKEENEKLKRMLEGKGGVINMQGDGGKRTAEEEQAFRNREQQLKRRQQELMKKQKSQQQRLKKLEEQLLMKQQEQLSLQEKNRLDLEELERKREEDRLNQELSQQQRQQRQAQRLKQKQQNDQKHKQLMGKHQQLLLQQQQQQKILTQQQLMLQKSHQDYQKFMEQLRKREQEKINRENSKNNKEAQDNFDDWDEDWDENEKRQNVNANINFLEGLIKNMQKTKQEKKKQADQNFQKLKNPLFGLFSDLSLKKLQKEKEQKQQKLPPYLENISKDIMINRKMKIVLQKNLVTVGKEYQNPPNDIIFGGRDITPRHAIIHIIQGKCILKSLNPQNHLYVNGQHVEDSIQLVNLDRVVFGWNSCYLFKNRDDKKSNQTIQDKKITWQFVKNELIHLVNIDESDSQDEGGCCQIF